MPHVVQRDSGFGLIIGLITVSVNSGPAQSGRCCLQRSSSPPLKDAAEKIDGEQDQDDDDENSDDGQDELLGWVLVPSLVKMGGTGAYSGDLERAFLPAEWLLSAAR